MSFYKEVPGRKTTLESTLKFDTEPKAGSTNPVTSDGVNKAIGDTKESVDEDVHDLQERIDEIAEKAGSGYIPKGDADVSTINALTGQENGWLYTLTDDGTLTDGSIAVVAGDTVAWDDANSVWYKAMNYAPAQYGMDQVKNLPTTITAFRTGDVIPVDGPDGTAKMAKDDLLAATAQYADKVLDKTTVEDVVKGLVSYNVESYERFNGIPRYGFTEWIAMGKHFSIPVSEGNEFTISPDIAARFVLMDSTFVDGNKIATSPYPATSDIITVQGGEEYNLKVDSSSKFLVLTSVDGGNNNITWSIKGYANTRLEYKMDVLSNGKMSIDASSLNVYKGSVKYSYQKEWYYSGTNPSHVNIPLKKNWVYEITPTSGTMGAIISNSFVGDKSNNDSLTGKIIYCNQGDTCKVVGTGSNYLVINVIDDSGSTLTYNITAKFAGEDAIQEIPMYTDRCTKYTGVPRYDYPMTWFPGGQYAAFEVEEGEIITISPSIDIYFVMCNSTFVPRNIASVTAGDTEISSRQYSRIPIKKGEQVTLTIASDEKYLIVNTKDGGNNSVTWNITLRNCVKTSHETKFKFAQWNIGHFSMGTKPYTTITAEDKAEKQAEYRALINSVGADILAVCEDNFYFATDNTLSRPAIYDCFSKCRIGYQHSYNANSLYFNLGQMVNERSYKLTDQVNQFRYVHEITLDIDGKKVIIVETHLDWGNADTRRAQIAELISNYSSEKYVILSADWNVMADVSDYDALKTAGYTLSLDDYLPALSTYPDQETCLDNVIVKGFTIGKVEINEDSIQLSDHNLVSCELTMIE